ncbi:palmitoyltransferase ZDHHC15 isoform X3 [Sminthopsis crassicaudata]|uniref:palmitoyltransferase ZDHHC15 isoform X3 n=1 Tax=Sminthopsis crassicaudata TaxID=9301 RepID=UPI003D69DCA3
MSLFSHSETGALPACISTLRCIAGLADPPFLHVTAISKDPCSHTLMTVANTIEKVIYLAVYHALFVFFIWTYWKSIFTLPHQPHQKFFMSYGDKERYENEERPEVQKQMLLDIAKKLPVYTRTGNGAVRFCDRCHLIKPDRCHHCSVCSMCVLKMDHHCPWVNNCIGFSNYKFFLQFLAYSVLYCLYIATTVFQYFIKYWVGDLPNTRSKFHVLFLLFVACMFFVSLMILFGYHCWLLSRNKTTLEAFSAPVFLSGPDKNGFNLGFIKNFQQVFGENKKLWLLPIGSSPGDGHSFPMRSMNESQNPLLANEEHWEDNEEDGRVSRPPGHRHLPKTQRPGKATADITLGSSSGGHQLY